MYLYNPLSLPNAHHVDDYGHFGPVVDGLAMAREIMNAEIPDYTWDTGDPGQDARTAREHNDYKVGVMATLNRRIEEAKTAYAQGARH